MFCILIPTSASTPFILGKSRMRKRACTDLCGGRSVMVVPTATVGKLRPHCCSVSDKGAVRKVEFKLLHLTSLRLGGTSR